VPDIRRAALILTRYSTAFYGWSPYANSKPRLNKYSGVLPCHCAMSHICSISPLSVYLKENVVFLNLYPYHGNWSPASQTTMGITTTCYSGRNKCDKSYSPASNILGNIQSIFKKYDTEHCCARTLSLPRCVYST